MYIVISGTGKTGKEKEIHSICQGDPCLAIFSLLKKCTEILVVDAVTAGGRGSKENNVSPGPYRGLPEIPSEKKEGNQRDKLDI